MTFLLGALGSCALWLYWGVPEGLGFFAGAFWSGLNIWLLTVLVKEVITLNQRDFLKIFVAMTVKFPLLYLAGFFLLSSSYLSFTSVVAGSLVIFIVLFGMGFRGFLSKTALWFLPLLAAPALYAKIDSDVPEIPNIFTLINHLFKGERWAYYLHDWDTVLFALILALVIAAVFILAARKNEMVPSGLQNAVEYLVDLLRKFVLDVLGPEGEKYVPFLGTLFVYILCMNWMAVIPFAKPPTSSVNVTIALALMVFCLVQYLNIRNWGLKGFLYHMMGSPKDLMGWLLVPLMLPIEILTQITRPLTLALRLFGNIAGEDILIGAAALFGVYLLSSSNLWVGIPTQLPFIFLALLTGLMQALVFTLLSAIYILLSMPPKDETH
jgi:F-type H+-transporting ATPase subunit a